MSSIPPFDKYAAYAQAVQSPKDDARLLRKFYRELRGADPKVLREDFCGAFALCCEWVKLAGDKRAIGIDLDPEALEYGKQHYLPCVPGPGADRVLTYQRNVLKHFGDKADIICALNFSYFIFQARLVLLKYFKECFKALRPGGLLAVDAFGGSNCQAPSVDVKRLPGLVYYWEQESFDPISNRAVFHIHFHEKGRRKRNRVFSYDWRMWTIPEIRDLMMEAGFKEVVVYWEGTARNNSGSGKFHRRTKGEASQVWLAYVVGIR